MSHLPFLIAGYGLTWLAAAAYLLRLRRRERELGEPEGGAEPPG